MNNWITEYDGDPNGFVLAPTGWQVRDLSTPGRIWIKTTGQTDKSGWSPLMGPINSVVPAITGDAIEDEELTVSTGTWSHAATYTYQWQRSEDVGVTWEDIDGEDEATYTLAAEDVGFLVRALVTAHNTVADGNQIASAPTEEVEAA